MLTKKRFTIFTFALVVCMFVFVTFVGPSGLLQAIAQYYNYNSANVQITSCGYSIPAQAIVGQVTATTGAFYAPNPDTSIAGITLLAGSKWTVIGVNSTKQYYKIMIACALAWIPVDTIGPSPDGPLANAPLPWVVVSDSVSTPN